MADGQSPENSPPAPPDSSGSPPSQNENSSSPPPPNQDDNQSSPPSPQQDNQSSAPPSDDNSSEGSSSSPPPPPSGNSSPPPPSGNPSPPPPSGNPSPPPPSQDSEKNNKDNDNNGNNNNNNNNNKSNNNNNNKKDISPPPPPKNSQHDSNPSPKSLASSKSGGGGSDSSKEKGLNTNAIIGIAVAGGLLLLVMICLCVCCCRKKKKKNPQFDQMPYFSNNAYGPGKASGEFYNSAPQQQYYNQSDHMMNLPPPPGAMGTNWVHSPPPPPPENWGQTPSPQRPVSGPAGHSSDMSSNFSGPHGPPLPPPHPSVALGFNKSTFTYEELAAATQGFSHANLLGQGGFGYVHKGFLPNGKEIAVKSLKSGSGQGEREFQAEVEIISRVHHRHLVSLVGYCIAGGQRMLVYEFVPNNTFEFHLHGKGRPVMDWPTRLKIALGSAKGLAYLHEDCHPRIIHRDIKGANILIDYSFEAKVADFGLAKLSQDNNTHVSTRVMGTFGYLAPEYASSGKLTEKSDVFSFGVMLLELITGRPPVDPTGEMEDSLVDWARPLCLQGSEDGNYGELVDPRLEKNYDPNEMARMVSCAAAAIRHSGKRRPKMSQIVRALEGDASLDDLSEGIKPLQRSLFGSSGMGSSTDYDYGSEMRKFRQVAVDGQDSSTFTSSTSSSHSHEDSRSYSHNAGKF